MNRQELYEAIITDVAKIVKRKILESQFVETDMYRQAVKSMTDYIAEQYDLFNPDNLLYYAYDIMNVPDDKLIYFIDLLNSDELDEEELENGYAISDVYGEWWENANSYKRNHTLGEIEQTVESNMEDILTEEELDAVQKDYDEESRIHNNYLMGGGYEAKRSFIKAVLNSISHQVKKISAMI